MIVNFNGKELLVRCLLSLLKTDYPNYEIVVVDNASTDGSSRELKKTFGSDPHLKIIINSMNLGHSEGCNIGVRVSESRYFVFLDSDMEFKANNWLTELVKAMEEDKNVGSAQAKILLSENEQCLDCVCTAVDVLGTWAANYGLPEDNLRKKFEIFAASSGCCIIRREIFNEVGGFDRDYFIYDDDTDLSLRVRLFGYKILFVPSSLVIHRGGILRGVTGRNLYYSSKNRMVTVLKNFELRNVWWRFLILSFFTFLVSLGFIILKKNDEAMATMRGLLNPIIDLSNIWRKRLSIMSRRRLRDSELVKEGFIRNDFRYTLQDIKIKLKNF